MNKETRELLEQHFDTAFDAPDGIKKLRELILTLAMQGKLVPQDLNDLFIIGEISLRELSKQLKEPLKILGREINPHVMDAKEFVKRKIDQEHFVTRILDSKKVMILGNENDLTKF
ncbi:MAG: hypothetical protein ACOYXC_21875 [Candidatus Rifleibacteriota bacterium]